MRPNKSCQEHLPKWCGGRKKGAGNSIPFSRSGIEHRRGRERGDSPTQRRERLVRRDQKGRLIMGGEQTGKVGRTKLQGKAEGSEGGVRRLKQKTKEGKI